MELLLLAVLSACIVLLGFGVAVDLSRGRFLRRRGGGGGSD